MSAPESAKNEWRHFSQLIERSKLSHSAGTLEVCMLIDESKCVACGNCIPICPMGAIHIDPVKKRATVNQDECVECYTCYRGMSKEHLNPVMVRTIRKIGSWLRWRFDPEPDVCPTDALTEPVLTWPRVVR